MTPESGSEIQVSSASAHAADPTDVTVARFDAIAPPQLDGEPFVGESPQIRRSRRGWLVRRALVAADVTGLLAAFAATELIFMDATGGISPDAETVTFLITLPAWILAAKLYGLYDRDEEFAAHSTADEVVTVFHLVTVVVWLYYAAASLFGLIRPDPAKLWAFWMFALLGMIIARLTARSLVRGNPAYVQNAVVVGAGDVGQLIGRKLRQHPEYRINLVGYVDADPKTLRNDLADVPRLGDPDEIVDIVRDNDVDRVIVAFSKDRHAQILDLVSALQGHDIQIDVVPRLYEAIGPNAVIHRIEGVPLLGLTPARIPRSSLLLKRGLDVIGASLMLLLTAPLMLAIAVLIRRDSDGPVFFRQLRLGMGMREFTLFKFRTMREGTDDAPHREYLQRIMTADALPTDNNLYKLDRSDAVTRFGSFLRRTSLDELPQLLNVLRGEMSLVGPRPAIPYELELYAPHHFERFAVPGGITGLWQVEARAHSTFGEALDLDVLYARRWSLGLDLRLLLKTPALMFRRRETG